MIPYIWRDGVWWVCQSGAGADFRAGMGWTPVAAYWSWALLNLGRGLCR